MSHFLSALNLVWPFIVTAIACAVTGWVSFKLGRRWRHEYREALANRKEYHALKADAQMRAVTSQQVRVNASPQINIGAGVLAHVRDDGYGVSELSDVGSICAFCGRFGCGSACREAVEGGRADYAISDFVDEFRPTVAHGLVNRAASRVLRRGDPGGRGELFDGNDGALGE